MWPDRVSNTGPLTYEAGALPTALRGPAVWCHMKTIYFCIRLAYLQRCFYKLAPKKTIMEITMKCISEIYQASVMHELLPMN